MNISRFFGSTNREALRQVRLALGPDALIVSNRRVNGGVEIMAADPTSVSEDRIPENVSVSNAAAPQTDVMREIGAMRGALESRIDELVWGNQLKQSTHAATLFQSLLGCGFSTALLRAMLTRLPRRHSLRAAQEWVRTELTRNLPVLVDEDALWQPGLTLALVGPTGVGKTTTIAKLAARAVQRHGSSGLALLTTDTYRIGAYEQLKIYGELLRVPVKVIQNAKELAAVLGAIPDHVTVLIDNVGVSQRDRYVAEQAAMLSATSRTVRRLLVLNASSHGNTLDEVARSYAKDGGVPLQGCIITKADEASSLGAALDTAIRYRLPIHFVSNGQKVPENLLHMTADALVDQAIAPDRDITTLYSPSQADFAALMSVTDSSAPGNGQSANSGVDRLLGALLSGEHDAQHAFQPEAFQAACDAVEDAIPTAEAWDLWHTLSTRGSDAGDDVMPYIGRMMRAVRTAGHARPDSPVLAVYGHAPVHGAHQKKGVLRAALMFDRHAAALISPSQQVSFPDGWWSSCGTTAQKGPTGAQALAMQIRSLEHSRPDWNVVHAFERGSQALLRKLSAEGISWISRVGAVSRVVHQGSLATVSAVARTLSHQSIADSPLQTLYTGPDGTSPTPVALWVAVTPIDSNIRDTVQAGLQLISVKVVGRADGRELKHLFGIAHIANEPLSAQQLASWLVNGYEARALFRCASRLWMASGDTRFDSTDMPLKTVLAAQSALAAWHLQHQPSPLRAVTARLANTQRPSFVAASTALHKLFALKMWLNESAAMTQA